MASLAVVSHPIDYEAEEGKIRDFINTFEGSELEDDLAHLDIDDDDSGRGERASGRKYLDQLQRIANRDQQMLVIDLEDIHTHEKTTAELVSRIRLNARRYVTLFQNVIDSLMPVPTKDVTDKDEAIDAILRQRQEYNAARAMADGDAAIAAAAAFPAHLLRRYNLYFKPLRSDEPLAVRDVRGSHLGQLLTVRGIVTRVSEVKPLLQVNAYTCDVCGAETFQDIAHRQFTPLADCQNPEGCLVNNIKGTLHMQTRACRFAPFQEVKLQEMADQVPVGHIPRSMTLHLAGNQTRSLTPGDIVHAAGAFLPTPYTGFQAIRAGLLTDTFLEVHHVLQLKKQYSEMEITPALLRAIEQLQRDPSLYNKLAGSIAPEIYGHLDVKKALLLLLIGGVTKTVGDGLKIRGDVNICLMGDPGVAKSQLLKYITKVAPRGVYTTGKGSSGVGLTAAVMRDPVTDEMVLEGGALVLADNGICCIDEFDKMEESDRTAIHEVMEQQTISISKAGITTTLNARTSILAAANPLFGRYNPKLAPVDNINLPAALLSRFDLLFLILDRPSREEDERLAHHVTHVHMFSTHPPLAFDPVDPVIMRHYIALARQRRPVVPQHVSTYVVDAYVRLRRLGVEQEREKKSHTYTSARTLLGVLRLAQALARLRFADSVDTGDVDEALRLMEASKESLVDEDEREADADRSVTSKIYRLIKEMDNAHRRGERKAESNTRGPRMRSRTLGKGPGGEREMDVDEDEDEDEGGELVIVDIRARILAAGHTEDQLMETILKYENIDVWTRVRNNSRLRFIDT